MNNAKLANWLLATITLAFMSMTVPTVAGTKDDVKALQAEVEQLKGELEALKKEVAELKKAPPRPAAPPAAAPFEPKDLVVGGSPVLGSADAPVTLFEYSDYQCPFCSRHATTVLPRLVNDYVDSGKLRIVMREYPIEAIHPRAFATSLAAHCAGQQGKYWEMHDLIFANQRSLSDDDLKGHSATLGLDQTAFDDCLASEAADEQIRAEIKEAYDLGISGTPSFVAGVSTSDDGNTVHVTEYIRGAQPFERFQSVIDKLLEESAEGE
jgi:protein-disulfide isomerase